VTYPAFQPASWLRNRHAHTIYAALRGRFGAKPNWRRERWDSPDSDFIDVDFLDAGSVDAAAQAPTIVMFHGLEGGSGSHYARTFARAAQASGWRLAIPHFRGCSGEINRLPRAYHSGDSEEIHWVLARMRERFAAQGTPLHALGISLGGNALLKWLGEQGAAAKAVVRSAAAISAPLDLRISGDALGAGFNRVYTRMFLATLKAKGEAKLTRHPGLFDATAMRRSRTLRDFDNAVTAPLHGFRDTDDYWTRASSRPWLKQIAVPTLIINARDDPFVPPDALPDAAGLAGCVTAEFPAHGGHAGFVTGRFPGRLDWLPGRVLRFFSDHI
jgi:predicted alpha/beta-fold hydrolase